MLSFSSPSWQSSLISAAKASKSPKSVSSSKPSVLGSGRAASPILPRLYLSDLFTARSESELTRLGITHVLSIIEHAPTFPPSIPLVTAHVAIADVSSEDLLAHFEETTAFIRNALAENEENKVLVHCFMGVSRSASVVCAYVIATSDMSAAAALAFVKARRGIVSPNAGFVRQLDAHAIRCHNTGSSAKAPRTRIGAGVAARIRWLKEAAVGASVSVSAVTVSTTSGQNGETVDVANT